MKIKRQKTVRKFVLFYKSSFGYRAPFRILIDGTFCKAALNFQINISEQLSKYLDAEVRMFTTSCALAECQALGKISTISYMVLFGNIIKVWVIIVDD